MTKLLCDRTHARLAVIDRQNAFLAKLAEDRRGPLAARIVWLIRVATALDIPEIGVAERSDRNGIRQVSRDQPEDLVL